MWLHEIYGYAVLETDLAKALLAAVRYAQEHPGADIGKIKAVFHHALATDHPSERHGDINVGDVHPPQTIELNIQAVDAKSCAQYLEEHPL